jgi:hypothetical protein
VASFTSNHISPAEGDTFLALTGGTKGVVFVKTVS